MRIRSNLLAAVVILVVPVVAVAGASRPAAAAAAAANPAVGLAYEAPDGCPDERTFVGAVTSRGADFSGGGGGAGAGRVMVVSIRRQEDGFVGVFQVRDDQTATNKREVHGPSCADVVDALAVVTAIALRPPEDAASPSSSSSSAATPPVAPRATERSATAAPPPDDGRLLGTTMVYRHERETVDVPAGKVHFDLERTLTLSAGAEFGWIPTKVMPRFDLSMVGANFVTTPDGAQRILGLVLRFRASFLGPTTYRTADTSTDVHGLMFGMGLCGTPHYDSRGLVLLACVEYGLGAMTLNTKATDGTSIQSKTVGRGTAGLGVEMQYNLGSLFHIDAKTGVDFALGQLTAEGATGNRIFGSSEVAAYGLIGVGLRF